MLFAARQDDNMTEPRCSMLLTTTADLQQANALANELVSRRLAACINILPAIHSVFVWQGELQQASECQLLIKTTTDKIEEIKQWLAEHHPYELPECLVIHIDDGTGAYLSWLRTQVTK